MFKMVKPSLAVVLIAAAVVSGALTAQGQASLRGTWNVHIEHTSGRVVDEQWIVEQNGTKVKGTVKTSRQELPLEGTVDGSSINVKVTVTSERFNIFRGTVDGDSIRGSIEVSSGDNGRFTAKRTKDS